jgi:hypothetical protein
LEVVAAVVTEELAVVLVPDVLAGVVAEEEQAPLTQDIPVAQEPVY